MNSSTLTIRLYGDPCLRKKSTEVKEVGPSERFLIDVMIATMHAHKGIGLAAPQVGINQRIIVSDIGQGPHVFINPKIIKRRGSSVLEEGCLSIPGVTVKIKRPQEVVVQYLDEHNQKREQGYEDILARVIQHETDHLNGKLIVDYASFSERLKLKKQLKEIKGNKKG